MKVSEIHQTASTHVGNYHDAMKNWIILQVVFGFHMLYWKIKHVEPNFHAFGKF